MHLNATNTRYEMKSKVINIYKFSRNKAVKCYCGELHLSNKDELNVNFWFLARILLVIFRTFAFAIYFNKFAFFVYGKSQYRMFQTGPLNFSSFWFVFFFVKFLIFIFLHYLFCTLLIQKWLNKKGEIAKWFDLVHCLWRGYSHEEQINQIMTTIMAKFPRIMVINWVD